MTSLAKLDNLKLKTAPKDQWIIDLIIFIEEAIFKNKLIQSTYDHSLIFEPEDLIDKMSKGQFCWGVINWRMIDRKSK